MKLGISLFKDTNVCAIIEQSDIDTCDLTRKVEAVYDTKIDHDLQDMFLGILELLEVSNGDCSKTLKEFFITWNTFSDENYIDEILNELYVDQITLDSKLLEKKFKILDEEKNSILKEKSWNQFVDEIKYKNRFFGYKYLNEDILEQLLRSFIYKENNKKIPFFRTRICTEETKKGFQSDEMGPPPIKYATAGRISPEGISCLYLSDSIETTFAEARVKNFDRVSVGRFIIKNELTLVDLSKIKAALSPFSNNANLIVSNWKNLIEMVESIERPIRPFDTKLDYLPSQIICGFIKVVLKVDGIKFNSTLVKNGINFALFSNEKVKCTKVYQYNVESSIQYNKKEVN